jgi:hypothetical protein
MELLGGANWWLPSGLDRLLPGNRSWSLGANEPAAESARVR